MSSPGDGVVSFTIDPACILVSPARWFDKCQNYMKSLLGRQILPQAGSSTSVFPFLRTTFLEEFQFLGDNCFKSLSQSEEEQVSVFSVSLPLPGQLQTERVQVHTSYYDWNNTGGCGMGRAITVLAKCPWVRLAVSSGKTSEPDSYFKRIPASICCGLSSPPLQGAPCFIFASV